MNSILEVEKAEILPKSKDSLGTQDILVRGGKKKTTWNGERREIVQFGKSRKNWLFEAIRNCVSLYLWLVLFGGQK